MFASWLRKQINRIDHASDFAAVLNEAGNLAALNALPELYFQSQTVAPTLVETKAFLSTCLAQLQPQTEWFTLSQAAKILGMSESGLRKLIRRDAIQYRQDGKHGRIRFRRDWLHLDAISKPKSKAKTIKPRPKPTSPIKSQYGFDPALLTL